MSVGTDHHETWQQAAQARNYFRQLGTSDIQSAGIFDSMFARPT
jgi:hypothetical protein